MRSRGEAVCVAVGTALCALLAAWIPGGVEGFSAAPGAQGLEALRLVEHLRAWSGGRAVLGAEAGGAVPLAGWPVAAMAAAIAAAGIPGGVALAVVTRALLGAWVGGLWALARGRGHGRARAALVCGVGLGPWAIAQARDGTLPFLGGAFFLAAAWASASRRAWGRPAALVCLGLSGAMDAGMGAIGALALAVAGGGSAGWRVSLVAAAAMCAAQGAGAAVGSVDGFDVTAPFAGRAGAVAPGLTALLAAALVLPAWDDDGILPRCGWGAVLAWVFSLGAMLRLGGAPALVFGHAIPLPGVLVSLVAGGADASAGAVAVAGVLVALGLAGAPSEVDARVRGPTRWTTHALGAVLLVEGAWAAAASWAGPAAPAGAAVTVLSERSGGLVVLPAAAHGQVACARAQWLARVPRRSGRGAPCRPRPWRGHPPAQRAMR
jgi:hypothetical protein